MFRCWGTCVCFLLLSFGAWAQGDWFEALFPLNRVLDTSQLKESRPAVKAASPVKIEYSANVVCVEHVAYLRADCSLYGPDKDLAYEWFLIGDTSRLGTGASLDFKPLVEQEARIGVRVKDNGYLVGGDTVVIYATTLPSYVVVHDTVCLGMEATVGVKGGNYWAWSTGGTAGFINIRPARTTVYPVRISKYPIVQGGYRNACHVEDSAIVTVNDSAIFGVAGDKEMCEGLDATVRVENGTDVYWNGVQGSHSHTFTVLGDTSVKVTATDKYGCRGTKEWSVIVVDAPRGEIFVYVDGVPSDSVCLGSSVRMEVVSDLECRYRWFNRDTLYYTEVTPQTDFTAFCDISVGGSVTGTVCKTRLESFVSVKNCHNVYFASGFMLEGYNKTYGPIGVNDTSRTYEFMIFNRNGTMVFSTTEFTEGWDGRYKGQLVPPGVYVYVYREKYRHHVWVRRGTFAVIK